MRKHGSSRLAGCSRAALRLQARLQLLLLGIWVLQEVIGAGIFGVLAADHLDRLLAWLRLVRLELLCPAELVGTHGAACAVVDGHSFPSGRTASSSPRALIQASILLFIYRTAVRDIHLFQFVSLYF